MTIPVIDAHHHIWRQVDLPWLTGPMVPRIFGPYEPIRRDYPIEEFLADIAGSGVVKSVYVQANWAPERAEDEVAWVQTDGRRDAAGRMRIVGYADLHGRRRAPGARPAEEVSAAPRHPHAAPLAREPAIPLRAAAGPRRRSDLSAELRGARRLRPLLRPAGVCAARWRARRGSPRDFPKTTFILQHAGMLEDLSEGGRIAWRSGMRAARGAAERRFEAFRPRHIHPSQRSRAHRLDRRRDGGALRRASAASTARIFRSRSCGRTTRR